MSPITLDLKAAAAATGLSQSHLKRLLDAGDLKGKRSHINEKTGTPDGKWLIKPADLAAYIDALPDG